MGNLCSSSKNSADPFGQPGRVLGDQTAPAPTSTSVPPIRKNEPPKTHAPVGRTLGGSDGTSGTNDARSAAARAAEERAAKLSAAAGKGKLSSQLAAQKAKTRTGTLEDMSRTERATRDVQNAEETRQWN